MTARDRSKMAQVPLGVCQVCQLNQAQHRHHIVNRSITQCDDPENLIALCDPCHRAVHAKTIDLGISLTRSQAAKAVLLMGTLSRAYDFLYPSSSPKRIGRAA